MSDTVEQLRELVTNTYAAARDASPYPPIYITAAHQRSWCFRVVDANGKPTVCPCCGAVKEANVQAPVRIELAPE